MTEAVEYIDGKKPVYGLLSATNFGDGYQPTGEHLINRVYQDLSSGAKAIGYYVPDSSSFYTSDIFKKLTDFKTHLLKAYDVFLNNKASLLAAENEVYK